MIARFERGEILLEQWTHERHVNVSFEYSRIYTYEVGIQKLEKFIPRLNERIGIKNSETSGFHKTLTVVWHHLIFVQVRKHDPRVEFLEFCEENPMLLDFNYVLEFYSRKNLFSTFARRTFTLPDIKPLPYQTLLPKSFLELDSASE